MFPIDRNAGSRSRFQAAQFPSLEAILYIFKLDIGIVDFLDMDGLAVFGYLEFKDGVETLVARLHC